MRRRRFLAAAAGATPGAAERGAALLPTDTPDEFGFRIRWRNPVPPIEKSAYRLEVGSMVENSLKLVFDSLKLEVTDKKGVVDRAQGGLALHR